MLNVSPLFFDPVEYMEEPADNGIPLSGFMMPIEEIDFHNPDCSCAFEVVFTEAGEISEIVVLSSMCAEKAELMRTLPKGSHRATLIIHSSDEADEIKTTFALINEAANP
jgi:hypothetical protein